MSLLPSIARHHATDAFDCGEPSLNEYLRRYARQNDRKGGAKTFVLTPRDDGQRVIGYYSIAPAQVAAEGAPQALTKGLGRYPVPGYRLARLAVAKDHQGQGLGPALLFDAGMRAFGVAQQAGGRLLVIDALNESAAAWYRRHGALAWPSDPLLLAMALDMFALAYLAVNPRPVSAATEA